MLGVVPQYQRFSEGCSHSQVSKRSTRRFLPQCCVWWCRESYLSTVGHNSNLLLNISPNMDGDIDAVDMEAYRTLGAWASHTFATPIVKVRASDVT